LTRQHRPGGAGSLELRPSRLCFGATHRERILDERVFALGRHADRRGLNEEVFDALLVIAAGSWRPEDLRRGWERVQKLVADMDAGRIRRLERIGFAPERALALSALHTRNFM
jgi:hypothetical protein